MRIFLVVLKWSTVAVVAVAVLLAAYSYYVVQSFDTETLPADHGKVKAELFAGPGDSQPLLVGLGGSEGGNAWASDHWKAQRDAYLAQGYALLAIGYFGMEGTPATLDRIALEGVHDAIAKAAADPRIDGRCIAVIGGSKGGELALTLASHYPDIKAVVAIVPPHAVFAGLTAALTTSSFTWQGKQVPFVPVPWRTTPALLTGNLRRAFEIMLEDGAAAERAAIAVEKINGPVLLVSATKDEFWPSTEMSERVVRRLEANRFAHHHQHVAVDGAHGEPLKHFDRIDAFLARHFKAAQGRGCG